MDGARNLAERRLADVPDDPAANAKIIVERTKEIMNDSSLSYEEKADLLAKVPAYAAEHAEQAKKKRKHDEAFAMQKSDEARACYESMTAKRNALSNDRAFEADMQRTEKQMKDESEELRQELRAKRQAVSMHENELQALRLELRKTQKKELEAQRKLNAASLRAKNATSILAAAEQSHEEHVTEMKDRLESIVKETEHLTYA